MFLSLFFIGIIISFLSIFFEEISVRDPEKTELRGSPIWEELYLESKVR